jgi:hypothetical protein
MICLQVLSLHMKLRVWARESGNVYLLCLGAGQLLSVFGGMTVIFYCTKNRGRSKLYNH